MSLPDILAATTPVVEALEALSVPYHLGGSVVSSLHGVPRSTLDVDLVADLHGRHVELLVERLVGTYYIDLNAVSVAVAQRRSFNVIHLETMLKVDIFVLGSSPFERAIFDRRQEDTLEDVEGAKPFFAATAEDIVLHKLQRNKLVMPYRRDNGGMSLVCSRLRHPTWTSSTSGAGAKRLVLPSCLIERSMKPVSAGREERMTSERR